MTTRRRILLVALLVLLLPAGVKERAASTFDRTDAAARDRLAMWRAGAVMVSERLVDVSQDYQGEWICISGQFRSYNRHEEKKNRLVLSVFARELSFVEEEDDSVKSNQIYLDGYICKPPVYRKTPLGREIADLLIAVNRPYGKSDYIPCICWGRNARYASAFAVGGHVLIWGRIQSREYMKRLSETEMEKRTAYEVSVSKLEYSES